LRIVKGPNVKKLPILAAAAALAMSAAPAIAGTTGNVVVTWNVQPAATLTMHTNYNNTGAFAGAGTFNIYTNNNSGTTGACNSGTAPTQADGTDAFGQITPDPVKVTDCLFANAVNLNVVTTSTNWNLTEQVTAGSIPAGYFLCALPNGTFSFAANPAGNLAVAQTTRTAATTPSVTSAATCTGAPANGHNIVAASSDNLANADTNATVAAGTNIGLDYELAVPVNAPTLASGSATITYTLVAN
jgi:hypothetical protein